MQRVEFLLSQSLYPPGTSSRNRSLNFFRLAVAATDIIGIEHSSSKCRKLLTQGLKLVTLICHIASISFKE